MTRSMCVSFIALIIPLCSFATEAMAEADNTKLNVLLICSDDMRPQLGCYGDATVRSPNIDRLAQRGLLFERSYVQQALCSPSRISMLSGRYPATTGIFEIGPPLRSTMPDITTVPQHFKNHGYHCRSFGKVYHVGIDDDASWSEPAWHSKKPRTGRSARRRWRRGARSTGRRTKPPTRGQGRDLLRRAGVRGGGSADDELLDGDTAARGIEQLRDYARHPDQPFFLGSGFFQSACAVGRSAEVLGSVRSGRLPLAKNEFLPKAHRRLRPPRVRIFAGTAMFPAGRSMNRSSGLACTDTWPRSATSMRWSAACWTRSTRPGWRTTRSSCSGPTTAITWASTRGGRQAQQLRRRDSQRMIIPRRVRKPPASRRGPGTKPRHRTHAVRLCGLPAGEALRAAASSRCSTIRRRR